MATTKRNFSGATIMTAQTLNDATEFLSSAVDLKTNGYVASPVAVDVNFGTAPEFNVIASIYGSLDGTDYDDTPIQSQSIDENTDPNQISFVVWDLLFFKVGVKQGGTVANDAVVTIKQQSWNYVSA